MASTNPFQHDDTGTIAGVNEGIAEYQGTRSKRRRARKGEKIKERKAAKRAAMSHGWPEWEGLRPVILFLMLPGILAFFVALTGPWPMWILYGSAALMGMYVFSTAFHGVELVLACFLLYLPFSTTYVIPVAPGVNGTNMLILLGLFASVMRMTDERQTWIEWPKGTTTVFIFGFLTCISAFTVMREPGGFRHILYDQILSYKGWVDQFIMYFIALSCIRSIEVAKRIVLYMCIGTIILTIYAIPEMLDKSGNSSIDKSRIGGPHRQPNMFGGFVAYTMLPIVAIFITYIKDIRAWMFSPFFLLGAKVLITTFSRGAYLAMAVGAFMAAYFKGKGFLILWATLGICALLMFPSLFPDAIKDRLFGSSEGDFVAAEPEKMDKSSETRIILWRAGGKMILESPFLGKGFKGFMKLKGQYTEQKVKESDPHNTYIYIAAQMGLPAMLLFLMILAYSFHLGRTLSRNRDDLFISAIGIGGASATVCYAVICVFGSRAVNLEFTSYFWAYLVCMQVIDMKLREKNEEEQPKKRRTNAFASEGAEEAVAGAFAEEEIMPTAAGQRRRKKRSDKSLGVARDKRRRLKHLRK